MYSSVRKTVRRTVIAAILCAVLCIFGASAEEPFTDADSKAAWVVENYTDSSMTDEERAALAYEL